MPIKFATSTPCLATAGLPGGGQLKLLSWKPIWSKFNINADRLCVSCTVQLVWVVEHVEVRPELKKKILDFVFKLKSSNTLRYVLSWRFSLDFVFKWKSISIYCLPGTRQEPRGSRPSLLLLWWVVISLNFWLSRSKKSKLGQSGVKVSKLGLTLIWLH